MKKLFIPTLFFLFQTCFVFGQEQTPATEAGEDFDLYGVIGLFEESEDLEDFEKKINGEDNDVNNLDLNKDEEVDMVKVIEYEEDNTHLLVLQAVLGEDDVQDIATIEIEKHSENEISLQVIGDVDIYGSDYIIEPAPEEGSIKSYGTMAVFVSVHLWPPVAVVFRPGRVLFVSAVIWFPRPVWFRPWRPIGRSTWRGRANRWHSPRFRTSRSRHSVRGRNMYSSRRKTSPAAKKNFGPKPGPNSGPSAGPSKSPTASPNNPGNSPAKTTAPNQKQKQKAAPQKKGKKH
jgi:hypothetical protein